MVGVQVGWCVLCIDDEYSEVLWLCCDKKAFFYGSIYRSPSRKCQHSSFKLFAVLSKAKPEMSQTHSAPANLRERSIGCLIRTLF